MNQALWKTLKVWNKLDSRVVEMNQKVNPVERAGNMSHNRDWTQDIAGFLEVVSTCALIHEGWVGMSQVKREL